MYIHIVFQQATVRETKHDVQEVNMCLGHRLKSRMLGSELQEERQAYNVYMSWSEMEGKSQNEYADGWRDLTRPEERTLVLTNTALAWSSNGPNELRTIEKSHIPVLLAL